MPIVDRAVTCPTCHTTIEASVWIESRPSWTWRASGAELMSATVLRYGADGSETSRAVWHWPAPRDVVCDCGMVGAPDLLTDA